MWFAPHVCNKTVHLVTPAVLKKLNTSSSHPKQKIICLFRDTWSDLGLCYFAIRQVENRRHITFLSFSFSLIQSIAQWYKLPNFFPLVWCVVKLPPHWVVCRRTTLQEVERSSLRLDVGRYLRAANFRAHHTNRMTEQKRLETKESTKYSVLEITTSTLFRLTFSDNLQDSSVI